MENTKKSNYVLGENTCSLSGELMVIKEINTKTGTPMAVGSLKVRKHRINIKAFKGQAESLLNFSVGDKIRVVGYLAPQNYIRDNGERVNGYAVILEHIKSFAPHAGSARASKPAKAIISKKRKVSTKPTMASIPTDFDEVPF